MPVLSQEIGMARTVVKKEGDDIVYEYQLVFLHIYRYGMSQRAPIYVVGAVLGFFIVNY